MSMLKEICLQFQFSDDIDYENHHHLINISPLGEGFINDTYIVQFQNSKKYLLQKKNRNIFTNIPAMMKNIQIVCDHIKQKVIEKNGNPLRESLTLIPTKDGNLFYQDESGEYWAACLFIEESITHQVANTLELAYQGGKGIGLFQSMVADLKIPLTDILPGFHNMRYRLKQWDESLTTDRVGRKATVATEIEWIETRKEEMMKFWELVENQSIPTRVSHNDTKITNILFDTNHEVLCVIDLDTVLNSTCLNDFGDAIRSYANTGSEDDSDLDAVRMDLNIFRAYTKGYLSQAIHFLTSIEIEYLAFSARYITYEQVLRFLMDYIDGDRYYKVKDADHNLRRTRAQYRLLQSMEEKYLEMVAIVQEIVRDLKRK